MAKPYDIVVFGATGYTGRWVMEYLTKGNRGGLKWAAAARDSAKLDQTLDSVSKIVGVDLKASVDKIICDVKDELSMLGMAEKASVVLNCVGPYRFSGEEVVRACIEKSASYVDLSGESQFLETMQLKYHVEAKRKGVYVVGACGYDSIPADVGLAQVRKAMAGPVNSVEAYVYVNNEGQAKGPSINFGTWQSAVHAIGHMQELKAIRRQLFPERLPDRQPRLKGRGLLHKSDLFGNRFQWCHPFPSPDLAVMHRSERARFQEQGRRPCQTQMYRRCSSLLEAVSTILFGGIFWILANFRVGRYLLDNYPYIFSGGKATKAGPPREVVENTNFEVTLVGRGWKGQGQNDLPSDLSRRDPEDRVVTVVVKGKNIGYGSTSECMIQSGLTILREKDKMPSGGGVYSPGYAFENTTLVQNLHMNGVTFTTQVKDL